MLEVREEFLNLMIGHGISEAEVISMTDEEFQMTLNAILDDNSPRALPQRQTYANRETRRSDPQYRGVTLPDGFGNGNYNEDEAVRMAIENSLDDMLIAPHLRQPPPPSNEVGFHPRPSSNIHTHHNTNYNNYDYRFEPSNYPPRPNPKPTPLPSSKTPRTNETSKYTPKDRSPSCSRPRRPAPPPSQYSSKPKTKSTTTSSGKTSNPQTKTRPTTTSTAAAPSSINHNLVVTNSKPKINSNAPIAGTVNKKSPRTTGSSKSTASGGSSGTRPSAGTRKTTTTPSTTTRKTTATTRPSNAPATRTNPTRPSNAPATRTGTKNAPSHPPSSHSSRTTGETIVHSNPTPRSRPKPNSTVKTDNTNNFQQKTTKKADDTNNSQLKPQHHVNPTFLNEAILDPTPDILHPKHFVNDDDTLLDNRLNYEKKYTKPKATNSNYNLPNPSPSQVNPKPPPPQQQQPKPQPKPKTEEKPPEAKFSESQILRNIQDMEFIMATQEAERKEREEAEKKAQEERKAQEEKAKKENKLDQAVRLFKSIPPEPANGEKAITIAAQMPNSKRIMRKFSPNSKGLHVYAWVSGQTLDLDDDEKLFVDSFDLMQAGGQAQALDKDSTLEEQKISGRVLFQAVLI